jgi:hypothetical protein
MKSKINTNLFKNIIETDFLLVSGKLKKNLRYLKSGVISSSDKNVTYSLEIFELIKSIKQLVRLIQFLKNQSNSNLFICSSNKQVIGLINSLLQENPSLLSINVLLGLTKIKGNLKVEQALLLLDEPLVQHNKIFKKLFEENILLVSKINSKTEANNYGTYKMYNDISDFKKLVFLILLINQVTL